MQVAVFSTQSHDREFLTPAFRQVGLEPRFIEAKLDARTVSEAEGAGAICAFVNDDLGPAVLDRLRDFGIRVIALRCAGCDNLDRAHAQGLDMQCARVPAYSPNAVAEHALALLLALNRHIPQAWERVRRGNFALTGLVGFDLARRAVGVIGTGNIGSAFARALQGIGAHVLAYDPYPNPDLQAAGVEYCALDNLLAASEVVSLHCPLTPETRYLMNAERIARLPRGALLINTGRGGLLDTDAAEAALDSGQLGGLGLDVYEDEAGLFFYDWSAQGLPDARLARLMQRDDVLVTGHQAFLTREALESIAQQTSNNLRTMLDDPSAGAQLDGRIV
ncbi:MULTISPECIES: 2-hydroxyacid dehydrogenase [unclassified Thioalkalivibrio]|uniref:2-hydroxyacid dehydrogenase n=1 Tax=unclassified Thioalkalivibrio TaxID=2621013 RepID=UPI000368A3AA|nr:MULTISPECIES: 2-hydroxyacid dehydrogenase [unclassified Thioalkalivibrio]